MTDSLDIAMRAALVREHDKWFRNGKMRPEAAAWSNCPACGVDSTMRFRHKDDFEFVKCRECGMVYTNPRLNDEATRAFYNGEWTHLYNREKFFLDAPNADDAINDQNLKRILALLGDRRGRFLEIGPGGRGGIMGAAERVGFEVHGVEFGDDNLEILRARFGDRIYDRDVTELGLPEQSFTVVYLKDVFEHVLHPAEMLREIQRITAPGGLLVIEVPNVEGWTYKLARERHTVFFGFAHVNFWAPKTLALAMNRAGFNVAEVAHRSELSLSALANYWFGPPTFTKVQEKPPKPTKLAGLFERLFAHPVARRVSAVVQRNAERMGRGDMMQMIGRRR